MAFDGPARVTAVLGPTNTGKTHYAIERMLGHRTGVIGLPLRLLAREVYDRIVKLRGPSVVALVTGEERIVPPRAAWWVCTVEAMPLDLMPEFVAIDEIQLCADPDRGHVFTQRLLNARGLSETLLLGADTMRATIAHLVPGVQFLRRERYSKLSYTGARKISRMPARSAVVGFSADDVYAIAELIRRQKGGAAVVMGALSPRTRNAQVELYQNGDVDYLVATDAIGMGLNLDIAHVAFSGVVKFDGRRHRHLIPSELAQIAGRAGRFTTDGTFGVTGDVAPLDPDVIDAIESSRFAPIRRLQWRNDRLDFGTPEALITSLEAAPDRAELIRAREADDLATLRALADLPAVRERLAGAAEVRLLWDVCQIPDYRKVAPAEHASLCTRLFGFLQGGGRVPTDWLAGQVARIDRTDGDIDALSKRLAYIRTWTYVAQRRGWIDDADHWRDETRAVEDRLSDALHARLTQRFVDRRTSVLMRRLKQRESLVAKVTETGEVSIDEQFIGRLEGFRFRLDPSADPEQIPVLRTAAVAALAPVLSLRADRLYNAPDTEIDVTEQGGLMWGEHAVGRLAAGPDALSPQIQPFVDEDVAPEVVEKIRRRLGHWIDRRITALFQPLIALRDDEALTGMARGIAFRLVEALGVVPRAEMAHDVKGLDQEGRASLRKHGVRFGQYTVFLPLMLKPAPTRLRLVLWSLKEGFEVFPEAPPPGLVTVPAVPDAPAGYYPRAGYRRAGDRAIRIDMLERLADMIRPLDARAGFEAGADMLSITGLTHEQFAKLMQGLGYDFETGTRPKVKAAKPAVQSATEVEAVTEPEATAEAGPAAETESAPVEGATAETPETAEVADAETAQKPEATEGAEAIPAAEAEPATVEGVTDETPEAASEAAEAADAGAGAVLKSEETVDGAEAVPVAEAEPAKVEGATAGTSETAPDAVEAATGGADAEDGAGTESEVAAESGTPEIELETFYIFTRTPRRRPERGRRDEKPQARDQQRPAGRAGKPERRTGDPGQGPKGKGPGKGRGPKPEPRREAPVSARPPRPEKPIDPDNPFAALLALKTRS